ncbi:MAG TPA: hypothetical protein ENJ88_00565 [Phaeodactylibacter sp.]|nr:hypothetical protein [Phaeodactylibacter sp.]
MEILTFRNFLKVSELQSGCFLTFPLFCGILVKVDLKWFVVLVCLEGMFLLCVCLYRLFLSAVSDIIGMFNFGIIGLPSLLLPPTKKEARKSVLRRAACGQLSFFIGL